MKNLKDYITEKMNPLNGWNALQIASLFEAIKESKGTIEGAQKFLEEERSDLDMQITEEIWDMFGKYQKYIVEGWADYSDELWSMLNANITGEWDDPEATSENIRAQLTSTSSQSIIAGYDSEGSGVCFAITLKNNRVAKEISNLLPNDLSFSIY